MTNRVRIPVPDTCAEGHLGFYRKGRLPHLDVPCLAQLISFRLHDSLPPKLARGLAGRDLDRALGRGIGECLLSNQRLAEAVASEILADSGACRNLCAWVIMPNHVHVLVETHEGVALGEMVMGWKGRSARKINVIRNTRGRVWQAGYYDRYIRDQEHLVAAKDYVEWNPVKAGLCERPGDWRFSSAWHRDGAK